MDGTRSDTRHWLELARAFALAVDSGRLLAATASRNARLIAWIGLGLVAVPRVAAAASLAIGVDPWAGELVLSLLLAAVVVSARRWRRARNAQALRQARLAHRVWRRYVPNAVAVQFEREHRLECGVREVTVLFADICGFTTLSEGRAAAEIFAIVSRFTQTVSEIVHHHGGCVTEFSGDGLMAVFGAPIRLPEKERAAVEAGLAIVRAMIPAPRAPRQRDRAPISVRVGIATGTDYVGEICAADRVIWSAIGNTTNLAARLQRLTRDLNAAILIDAPTRDGSKAAAAEFQIRRSLPIRGRRDAQDAYMLPTSARGRFAPDRPGAVGMNRADCIAAMRNFDMSSASVGPALARPGSPQ